ncbi:MAG: ferritin-like domain-containing protein [Gemmatimonas sp.]
MTGRKRDSGKSHSRPSAPRSQLAALLLYAAGKALHADRQLVAAFPKLAKAANDRDVRRICREGVDYSEERIARLLRVFDLLGAEPRVRASPAMKGLIQSALNAANNGFDNAARDAAILDSVFKISHFGRAGYWMACAYAEALGDRKVKAVLMQSLKEKEEAIEEMMRIAEGELVPRIQREDRAQGARAASPRPRLGARPGAGAAAARTRRASDRRSASN